MDLYHIWCDLKPGVRDVALLEGTRKYLGYLQSEGLIESWRLTRRKLGLGPAGLGEFKLAVRATDGNGELQHFEPDRSPFSGATGLHKITVYLAA